MAIKAVIFDCFGVLALTGTGHLWDMYPDLKDQIQDLSRQSDRGYIDKTEYQEQLSQLTGMSTEQAESSFWLGDTRNSTLFELIMKMKKEGRYKIGLLSNIGKGWMDDFIPDRNEVFDAVVLSGEVGVSKPDPEIYKIAVDKLGVAADECVFVDDQVSYCEGAGKLGIKTILFENTAQAMSDLDKILKEDA